MATPADPKEAEELTQHHGAACEATYGKGKWCPDPAKPDTCLNIDDVTQGDGDVARTKSELREVWEGWHTISPPMKKDYARFVELSNKGAKELGFADTGAMWRAKYDMPPDEFTKELDRLWDQVRPLYLELHAYVRMKLREKYGDVVPANGPIPAHLLGNIWAQDWSNIYPLVAPAERRRRLLAHRHPQAPQDRRRSTWSGPASASTRRSASRRCRRRSGSARCSSGRAIARSSATPAPGTSTSRPTSASRCASSRRPRTSRPSTTSSGTTSTSAPTRTSRCIFRDSANDGFHEAIGDTIALSVTPEYLVQDRPARQGARRVARHRPADDARAREGRVPALRPADRSVALEGVLRRGEARATTTRRGGICG